MTNFLKTSLVALLSAYTLMACGPADYSLKSEVPHWIRISKADDYSAANEEITWSKRWTNFFNNGGKN